jgi:hypothetical protein
MLFIHPTHLSNTIKDIIRKSPFDICYDKKNCCGKEIVRQSRLKIAEIAFKLTYESTNFTKYFK